MPAGALRFVPGRGESVGRALVADRRIALIAFTGSRATGLEIVERAARTPLEQPHVKRVVCEMGGNNAIIVDDSADLDEAVIGVRDAAFLYAGQRCSACSRAVVLDRVYDRFLERLTAASRALVLGDPAEPDTDIGPVIDADAGRRIRRAIDAGRAEATLALAVEPPEGLEARMGRPVIGPHVFSDVRPEHALAREEIFGPVLSVLRAESFDEALAMALATPYRLTGGLFSRTPSHLARARRDFRVGNLYLNRGITGSLVGRQPFGGFGHSGVGAQSGGDDYLTQFVVPRTVCENTMRRGFAPGLETGAGGAG